MHWIVTVLICTHIACLVTGWIIGASKASYPPDREMDEYSSKEPVNGRKAILEHLEKKDEGADSKDINREFTDLSGRTRTIKLKTSFAPTHNEIYRSGTTDHSKPSRWKPTIDDETPIIKDLETEMAQYIILKNGWELKPVGDKETKIVATNTNDTKYIITKQLTSELNKWIVDNYEPNGELKPLQESNEN